MLQNSPHHYRGELFFPKQASSRNYKWKLYSIFRNAPSSGCGLEIIWQTYIQCRRGHFGKASYKLHRKVKYNVMKCLPEASHIKEDILVKHHIEITHKSYIQCYDTPINPVFVGWGILVKSPLECTYESYIQCYKIPHLKPVILEGVFYQNVSF